MEKIQKILVAADFTKHSNYAVQSAASIVKKTGAQLIILHVLNKALNHENGTSVNSVRDKMDQMLKQCDIKDCKIIYELSADVQKAIIKSAINNSINLIIMGAYGTSKSDQNFIGSNTESVMLNAEVPVLIVKDQLQEFSINNIVLASDFQGEIYSIFPKMKRAMDLFDSNTHLLKINTKSHFQRTSDSMKLMTEFAIKFELTKYTKNIYNDLSIEDGIINFTKQVNADLIVITPNGLWKLAHIFNTTTTDKLMKKTLKMILSMKSS